MTYMNKLLGHRRDENKSIPFFVLLPAHATYTSMATMTRTVPLLEASPSSAPPSQTRWPRTIEISTRITIPLAFNPETFERCPRDNEDPTTSCLADTNVSIKFPDQKPPEYSASSPKTASPASSVCEEAVPAPDQTFLIRDPECGKSIVVIDGNLQLHGTLPYNPASQWTCFEANGWLGFRNRATRMVMGHNGRGWFHAKVTHHRAHEWFQARRHPDGGYLLLVKHRDYLWRMDVAEDGKGLLEKPEGGKRWEFVAVD